jgi:GntR family histidine utilization transcriptional repressor
MHDHSAPRTLHARIRGEWPAGHRIPREHELTEQYGCSRMTVNKAIAALVADGLVIRNKKAGSFVARPRMHSAVMHIPDIQHEIEAGGQSYAYRCLNIETRPACCQYLGAEGHELGESLFIRSVHLSDGSPLLLEERYIFLNSVPAARAVDFHTNPPGTWLLSHVPWTEAEHRISAYVADAATARLLALSAGSACLVVERRTFRGPDTLTRVRQIFRGDAYHLTARFGPSAG